MILQDYPYFSDLKEEDIKDIIRQICYTRKDDILQAANLDKVFVSGRKVGKVPSSSADVAATDRVGDFNVNATYAYFLIDNSGTPEWRRVSVGSW